MKIAYAGIESGPRDRWLLRAPQDTLWCNGALFAHLRCYVINRGATFPWGTRRNDPDAFGKMCNLQLEIVRARGCISGDNSRLTRARERII